MKFKIIFLFSFLLSLNTLFAQNKNKVLFKVANENVYTDEFLRVFNKNRDIVSEENKKTLKEYLQLYINYKLKLKEAYDLKYDTVKAYQKELEGYRQQLVQPYLKDSKVTEELVKEAYNRTKIEVNASHILIRVNPDASPTDTLKAYNTALEARNKIINGMSFEEAVQKYSFPQARINNGNLGYFSAFDMIYPFEDVAYKTEVDEISMPFRTKFGYHIVKVNGFKPSKGEVEVEHIMIKEDPRDSLVAKTKINELYAKLKQGENFELMAKLHSDDKRSAINGGKLPKFNERKMIEPFSDIAFSLKNPGDISKPFKTPYGWHIVKLIQYHPIGSFESMKKELTSKIENSERASIAGESIVHKLFKKYNIIKDKQLINAYVIRDSIMLSSNYNNAIFSINKSKVLLSELLKFEKVHPELNKNKIIDIFLKDKVLQYYTDHLEETNNDFANTFNEYKDGLLLFNILQDKIWKKAETDSLGMQTYFKNNQQNYYWPKRADMIVASCSRKDKAEMVKKYLQEDIALDTIKKLINEGATIHVLFTKGLLEEKSKKLPENFTFISSGVSEVMSNGKNNYQVIKINKIIEPEPMQFNEARGMVVNDYQQYLEKQWIAELRKKYPVKINKSVLKKLEKQQVE